MKRKRINEIIAEHCVPCMDGELGIKYHINGYWSYAPPDYYRDLNAVHEAVKRLNRNAGEYQPGGFGLYLSALEEVCDYDLDAQIEATAAQRAEAFVKAINKWEEE